MSNSRKHLIDLQNYLAIGEYQTIITELESKTLSDDEYWLLIETYAKLENLEALETLLQQKRTSTISPQEQILLSFFQNERNFIKGKYKEMEDVAKECLTQENILNEDHTLRFLNQLAVSYWRQGLYEKSLEILNQILVKHAISNNSNDLSYTYNLLAMIHWVQGNLDRALENAQNALKLSTKMNNPWFVSLSLNNIGLIYHEQGKLSEALDHFSQALTLREKLENKRLIADTLNNIANIYWIKGELANALTAYQRSLTLRREHSVINYSSFASTLCNLATVFRAQGRLHEAFRHHLESLKLREEINNPSEVAVSSNNLALVYYDQGEFQKAYDYHLKAYSLRKKVGHVLWISESLCNLGITEAAMGRLTENSLCFTQFPSLPWPAASISGYKLILDALLAKDRKLWNAAATNFQQASLIEGMEYDFQIFCQEMLAEVTLRQWETKSTSKTLKLVQKQLENYQQFCIKNSLVAALCKVYLLRSKLFLTTFQYSEAIEQLQLCLHESQSQLPLHHRLASEELRNIVHYSTNKGEEPTQDISFDDFSDYLKHLTQTIAKQE